MSAKVEVRDLVKSYEDKVVLRGVDLDVDLHEVVCLIGSSGSGKSTLLKCINLLVEIDHGEIWLDGTDITDPSVNPNTVRQKMGIVFQAFNLFPHMTVLRNITLGPMKVHGVSRAEAEDRARSLLDRFGLLDKQHGLERAGEGERVAVVRALAIRPELMLFDEVTSALDPELVAEVLGIIRDLKDEGMTMIVATHEMGVARDLADKVCFLDDGVFLETGTAEQIFTRPREARTQQFLQRIVDAGRL